MLKFFPHQISPAGNFGLLLVRLVMGSAFVLHGMMKIPHAMSWMGPQSNVPGALQALAALSECGGGMALIVGLLTPLAALGIVCTMIGALVLVHFPNGDPFVGKNRSFELPLMYLVSALALASVGPGKFSLDALFFGRPDATMPEKSRRPLTTSSR